MQCYNMEVYLVRHTSVDVPRGICYGQSDVPVRETFPQEAAAVKAKLQHLVEKGFLPDSAPVEASHAGQPLHFDAVYTSPLSRCTRLAEFCGYGDAPREPRIKEMNFGDWEMQDYNSIKDPHLLVWFNDWVNVRTSGGESFADQLHRVGEFLQELKDSGKENVLLFCHGGVLACAKVLGGKIGVREAFSTLDDYGSIIKVTI